MFFEHYHDLVPLILSISLYVTIAGSQMINFMSNECVVRNRYMANREIHSLHLEQVPDTELIEKSEERQNWITRIVKRKEAPEDDADYFSFSLEMIEMKRGGLIWEKHLCSRT
ncbi:hypothetical protein [Alteribacter populi]|uniref:hypothetical protein n=1 Tax=Alteribacter populi TaxID=2011011 RepID=UPI000BBAE072|nr:hypothetical protein [Alteribacter populi]